MKKWFIKVTYQMPKHILSERNPNIHPDQFFMVSLKG